MQWAMSLYDIRHSIYAWSLNDNCTAIHRNVWIMLGLCDNSITIHEACTLEGRVTTAMENNASRVLVPFIMQ